MLHLLWTFANLLALPVAFYLVARFAARAVLQPRRDARRVGAESPLRPQSPSQTTPFKRAYDNGAYFQFDEYRSEPHHVSESTTEPWCACNRPVSRCPKGVHNAKY